ncbi:MAG: hypothetical protein FWH22_10605, partial [Fibromonadales bacterium]|nr:hypothetical protein [Fibromonadales bacterium]
NLELIVPSSPSNLPAPSAAEKKDGAKTIKYILNPQNMKIEDYIDENQSYKNIPFKIRVSSSRDLTPYLLTVKID